MPTTNNAAKFEIKALQKPNFADIVKGVKSANKPNKAAASPKSPSTKSSSHWRDAVLRTDQSPVLQPKHKPSGAGNFNNNNNNKSKERAGASPPSSAVAKTFVPPASFSPSLNPSAKEFVPSPAVSPLPSPMVSPSYSPSPSLNPKMDPKGLPALPMLDQHGTEEKEAVDRIRKELKGKKICYSVKDLIALKPLNPNAKEYKPLWLFGIHSNRDLELPLVGQA